MSDQELDEKVSGVLSIHRQCGEKTVSGCLKVQRQRIRESMRRVDPLGVELRSRTVLHRRGAVPEFLVALRWLPQVNLLEFRYSQRAKWIEPDHCSLASVN